ncbi:MAG: hypothetical protein FWE05_04100 [Defluviitaleaceae bacterium]|nr:hypothetical protein [Defluviitaleaceae bacterium]
MEKTSKKYTKILLASLVGMLILSIGAPLIINSMGLLGDIRRVRSGTFTNVSQRTNSEGWYFSADEANGNAAIFIEPHQITLDNLFLESSISSGGMSLTITQGNVSYTFDLSESNHKEMIGDYIVDIFESRRIEMRILFVEAENVSIEVHWQ